MINLSGVYRIVHREKGKLYIGSSVTVRARLQAHRNRLRRGVHDNCHLQRAWIRDGESAFEFESLVTCRAEDLARTEQWWVDYYRENGVALYNQRPAVESNLGMRQSAESRAKMSAAKRNPSTETRARMSVAAKQFRATHPEFYQTLGPRPKWTEAQRDKLRGRAPWNKGKSGHRLQITEAGREAKRVSLSKRRGQHASLEARAKMRAAKLGKSQSPETRVIRRAAAVRGWEKRRAARF